jgi:hypothetical protein
MKFTKNLLKQIINKEIQLILKENAAETADNWWDNLTPTEKSKIRQNYLALKNKDHQ